MTGALEIDDVSRRYGRRWALVHVSLTVQPGQSWMLLGHNGSGKSTTIRTVMGLQKPLGGRIHFDGHDVSGQSSRQTVRAGMAMIPSERFVFADLTVTDNLLLGGANDPDEDRRRRRLEFVRQLFPILVERSEQFAGTMSGGQQRMVSLGLALMTGPRLLMLDEPSLGLAPLLVAEIFEIIERLNRELDTTILIVEQNARLALDIADHGYIMENGRIVFDGTAETLRENEDVKEFYLGVGGGERKSFKDVKSYKRRKRWLA